MNILITGGAGFIGQTLYLELAKLCNQVTLMDKKKIIFDQTNHIHYIQANVCDRRMMLNIFENYQFDGVIHLAAVSRVVEAERSPKECKETNIKGSHSLLDSIEKSQQKPWLIFGSSREVYGEQPCLPVKENASLKPVNIYGKTKVIGEQLFYNFAKKNNLNCAIIRFSNVYGNSFDIFDRIIPKFMRAVKTGFILSIEGGDQLIDFTHINDTIHFIITVIKYLNSKKNIQENFHCCPGIGWSLQELIHYIEIAVGKKAKTKKMPKRSYDVVKFVGDTAKIKNILGLNYFISLEEGIYLSINEYC